MSTVLLFYIYLIRTIFKQVLSRPVAFQSNFFEIMIQLFLVDSENSEKLHEYICFN